jgi:D-3-phosphoglycerate dehydrogenase
MYNPDLKAEALEAEIKKSKAEAVVVRSTKVTEPMLEDSHLSLVIRAGSGYDTIDVGACSKRGIYVANCPGKNGTAVAELAFALILALDRRIADNVIELRAKKWNKKGFGKGRGLHGRTLGLIGVGQIGTLMIERARAFGMPVVGWGAGRGAEGVAGRSGGGSRRGERPPGSQAGDQRPLRGEVFRRHAQGRLLHQHLPGRGGG